MAKQIDHRALGTTFIALGVGMTLSMGLTLGVAFIGIGIPFIVIGAVYLSKHADETKGDGGEG